MQLKYKLNKSSLYVYFDGELDNYSAKSIVKCLDDLINDNVSAKSVIFNLSELSFLDSSGVGVILGRYKKLSSLHIPLYIENPTMQANKLFELSGVYNIIPKC